jgi:hypothetical protein
MAVIRTDPDYPFLNWTESNTGDHAMISRHWRHQGLTPRFQPGAVFQDYWWLKQG